MKLVKPSEEHIPSYLAALRKGWHDLPKGSTELSVQNKIQEIIGNPAQFLELFDDPNARALPYLLPDHTVAYAVSSIRRWMWDEQKQEFCGSVSLRWQRDTTELPPHLMGHIGYSVPTWKRNLGFASFGLSEMLKIASKLSLPFVHLVTDIDNKASIRVIQRNGGILLDTFTKPPMYGPSQAHRYKIELKST